MMGRDDRSTKTPNFFVEQQALRDLNEIKALQAIIAKLNRISNDTISDIEHMMMLAQLMDSSTDFTDKVISYFELKDHGHGHHSQFLHVTEHVMSDINIGFAALQFLIAPTQYIWAWAKDRDIENKFALNSHWALATIFLVLSIVAAALSTLALPLGMAAAFISIGTAVVSIANNIYQKESIKEKVANIDQKLKPKLSSIESTIKQLSQKLDEINNPSLEKSSDDLNILIQEAHKDILSLKAAIKDSSPLIEQKIKLQIELKEYGMMNNIDQAVKIPFAATVITGIVIALTIAPPIGLLIIGSAVGAGFVYALARSLPKLTDWVAKKFSAKKNVDLNTGQDEREQKVKESVQEVNSIEVFLKQNLGSKFPVAEMPPKEDTESHQPPEKSKDEAPSP